MSSSRLPIPRVTSFVTIAAGFVSSSLPTAVYAVLRARIGFSATMQTVIFSGYLVGMMVALLLAGRWLRRLGERGLMMAGVVLLIVAGVGLMEAGSAWVLLAARLLQGVALGAITVGGSAALYAAVPVRSRKIAALLVTLSPAVGCFLGPPLGGYVADFFGRGTREAFGAAVILLLVSGVLLLVHGNSPVGARPATSSKLVMPGRLAPPPHEPPERPRSMMLIGITAGLPWFAIALYQSLGPSLLGHALGANSLGSLGVLVGLSMGTAGLTQALVRNVPIVLGRRLGLSTLTVGFIAFCGMLETGSVLLSLVATLAIGIGHGLTYLSATREIGELANEHPERAASLMSRYFTVAYVGVAIPIIALGLMSDAWGLVPAALCIVGLLACACVAMLFSSSRRQPPPAPRAATVSR